MQQILTIADLEAYRCDKAHARAKIALVPTMGALHEGHLSLIGLAKQNADLTIASIFINPLQFHNPEDLEKYPQSLEKDVELLTQIGCDAVFAPNALEMYPGNQFPQLSMRFGLLERVMEGKHRPGHFNGVGVIVAKLFNLVKPHIAVFGQKDFQQVLIIKELVSALSYPIEILVAPTARTADGLALSSRNQRLSAAGLHIASNIHRILKTAALSLRNGIDLREVKSWVTSTCEDLPGLHLEYFEVAKAENLRATPRYFRVGMGRWVLCMAAVVEGVRLIDNLVLEN